jgi:hypothetical protein
MTDMKTLKPAGKSRNVSNFSKNSRNQNATLSKRVVSEIDIHEKANDIYHQRIDRGETGNAVQDWIEAEKILREMLN